MATEIYAKARRHLGRRDPVLKRLIALVGPCTLQSAPASFPVLTRAIVSQLISTKAANSVFNRVVSAVGDEGVTPQGILKLPEAGLRGCGLSGAKTAAIRDLAERTASGALPLDRLAEMGDDEVIARLTEVRGIGVWTAEMFLIFSLGRLDVLPLGDLGLRAGVKNGYGLAELPGRKELLAQGEPWRPYRSVATWYFWRSRGFVPQSE